MPESNVTSLSGARSSARPSLLSEFEDARLAVELIELGARIQVLESITSLPRSRLLRLYKEVKREAPPKGMLPFSEDWFLIWRNNIHASLFVAYYRRFDQQEALGETRKLINAYQLYAEQALLDGHQPVLDITRAWTLIRFLDSGLLETTRCPSCSGDFIALTYSAPTDQPCAICRPPSRANGRSTHSSRSVSAISKKARGGETYRN